MKIDKEFHYQELKLLVHKILQLPEVEKIKIRENEVVSVDEDALIRQSVEDCYHDVLSDLDVGIHVKINPKDRLGYATNPQRLGFTREKCLGLAIVDQENYCQYRVIQKNGMRYDIGFYISEDENAPIYNIGIDPPKPIKEEGNFWPRWELEKADMFWFEQVHAIAKLYRGDYLIADHLANMQINETLVAQMIERDNRYGINFHRYGDKECLEYLQSKLMNSSLRMKDETFQMIAEKIYQAGAAYDELIQRLNPEYSERLPILWELWLEYDQYEWE